MKKKHIFLFLVTIQLILFLMHLVIYEGIASLFPDFFAANITAIRIVFLALWVSFVATSGLTSRFNNIFTRVTYRSSNIWLGYMFYLFLAFSAFGISVGLVDIFSSGINMGEYGLALMLLALFTATYGLVHSNTIHVKKQIIELANVPQAWKSKNIVWISDIHLGQIRGQAFMDRIVKRINMLNPDIVFIGGDLYDGVKVNELQIISPLKHLKTKLGTYFITGNHDGFSDMATIKDIAAIEQTGIKVLRDHLMDIEGLQIIGIDYRRSASRDGYKEILHKLKIDKARPSILLKHVPSDVDMAADAGVSLQISGHTHKAQVQPLSFLPEMVFKGFSYGLNKLNNLQVLTSSGVGTWGPPFRVGTNSEIILINLK